MFMGAEYHRNHKNMWTKNAIFSLRQPSHTTTMGMGPNHRWRIRHASFSSVFDFPIHLSILNYSESYFISRPSIGLTIAFIFRWTKILLSTPPPNLGLLIWKVGTHICWHLVLVNFIQIIITSPKKAFFACWWWESLNRYNYMLNLVESNTDTCSQDSQLMIARLALLALFWSTSFTLLKTKPLSLIRN